MNLANNSNTLKTSRFAGNTPREITLDKTINTPRSNIGLNIPSVRHSTGTVTPRVGFTPRINSLSRSQSIKLFGDSVNLDELIGSEVLKAMNFALNPVIRED